MDVTYIKHHNGVVHQSGGLCAVSISIEGLDLNIKRVKCRHMFKNLLSLMLLFLILKGAHPCIALFDMPNLNRFDILSISIFFKSVDISTIDMSYRYIEQG